MSIISSFKRAFGIDTDDLEPDSDYPEVESENVQADVGPQQEIELPADDRLPADMLDAVVRLFNSTQPDFVRNCLDTDAQKNYLFEALDRDIKDRLEAAVRRAHEMGLKQWEDERKSIADEVVELKRQKQELEQRREESKSARLSAERQKRALSERVHDLETQVMSLESEKEQYMLENRSMLNKLRVAGVTGVLPGGQPNADAAAEELDRLQSENETLRSEHAALTAEKDSLTAEKNALVTEKNALEAEIERIKEQLSASGSMQQQIDDLESQLASERERHESTKSLLADEQTRNNRLTSELESLRAAMNAAVRNDAGVDEEPEESRFNAELTDDVISRKPEDIQPVEKKPRKRRARNEKKKAPARISAIDELMDSTDWLLPSVPDATKEPPKEDDFGYQAPPRKAPEPVDDRQLSLF